MSRIARKPVREAREEQRKRQKELIRCYRFETEIRPKIREERFRALLNAMCDEGPR
jgi:hypothetical protein